MLACARHPNDQKRQSERQGRAERNNNRLKLGRVSNPLVDEIFLRLARVALAARRVVRVIEDGVGIQQTQRRQAAPFPFLIFA